MSSFAKCLLSSPTADWRTDFGLLLLRVSVGAMMLFSHGWGKLTNFATFSEQFADPLGVGSTTSLTLTVFAEFFCSIALILGLATRLAAIPLLITMLVAAFVIHAADPWPKQEFPLLFAIIYASLIFLGSGRYSVDGFFSRKLAVHSAERSD